MQTEAVFELVGHTYTRFAGSNNDNRIVGIAVIGIAMDAMDLIQCRYFIGRVAIGSIFRGHCADDELIDGRREFLRRVETVWKEMFRL